MYKIAHISDLHISFNEENENARKFVDLLKDIRERDCDHILITGDLVENPEYKDLLYVREILHKFDLLDASKVSIVPGNHDIFGGARGSMGAIFFPQRCRNTDYDKNSEQFIDAFKESFPQDISYPNLKILNNIAMISINSVERWSEKNNPEGSNGIIETENYNKLERLFSEEIVSGKIKIVLLHHHLNKPDIREDYPAHSLWLKTIDWKMKLHGRKTFLKFLKKHKVNMVLHGHTHISELYLEDNLTIINSSAASVPLTDDPKRKYNIISIPGDEETTESIKVKIVDL